MKIISNHFLINMDFLWLVMWLRAIGLCKNKGSKMFVGFIFCNNNHQLNIVRKNSSSFCWDPLYHCHFLSLLKMFIICRSSIDEITMLFFLNSLLFLFFWFGKILKYTMNWVSSDWWFLFWVFLKEFLF